MAKLIVLALLLLSPWFTRVTLSAEAGVPQAREGPPLLIAVDPVLGSALLRGYWRPASEGLSLALGRPVDIHTTASPEVYAAQVAQTGRAILVWAPVQEALRLSDELGYRPFLHLVLDSRVVVYTLKTSPVESLEQLAGRRVALPGAQSLASALAVQQLPARGLAGRTAVDWTLEQGHDGVLFAVVENRADAGVGPGMLFDALTPQLAVSLRTIEQIGHLPGLLVLASPAISDPYRDRLRHLLMEINVELGNDRGLEMELAPFTASELHDMRDMIVELRRAWEASGLASGSH